MEAFVLEKSNILCPAGYSDRPALVSHFHQRLVSWNKISHMRLSADYCVIYRTISCSCSADANQLQQDLCKLENWQNERLMRFNEKKCYVMRITQDSSQHQFQNSLNESQLQSTSCNIDLGLEISKISSDLK